MRINIQIIERLTCIIHLGKYQRLFLSISSSSRSRKNKDSLQSKIVLYVGLAQGDRLCFTQLCNSNRTFSKQNLPSVQDIESQHSQQLYQEKILKRTVFTSPWYWILLSVLALIITVFNSSCIGFSAEFKRLKISAVDLPCIFSRSLKLECFIFPEIRHLPTQSFGKSSRSSEICRESKSTSITP